MLNAITVLLLCHAVAAAPLVTAPQVPDGSIVIDGSLTDAAWAQAQQLVPFTIVGDGVLPQQPQVLLCRDASTLYLSARLPKPAGTPARGKITERDGPLWEDDSVEIFLDPGFTKSHYIQLIVNSAGTKWDSVGKDKAFNADWQAATVARDADAFWTLEVAVPIAAVGPIPTPAIWGLNVCWDRQTPSPLSATWAPLAAGNFHDPEHFGNLAFSADAPGITDAQIEALPNSGQISFSARLSAGARPATVQFLFGKGADLKPLSERTLAAGQRLSWSAKGAVPFVGGLPTDSGDYSAHIVARVGDAEVYHAVIPMAVPPPVKLDVRKFVMRTMKVLVDADASLLAAVQKPGRLKLSLVDASGAAKATADGPFDAAFHASVWLDVKAAGPGDFKLTIAVADPAGKTISSESRALKIPPKPVWMGNREGISDKVLAPWTPLEVKGGSVRPWGRDYHWGALPFPEQVTTRDADVLAGPMRLVAIVDGHVQPWGDAAPKFTKVTDARTEFTTTAEGPDCTVTGTLWVEYDGCVHCDWKLTPKRPGARLDRLTFEMPIKAQYAKYLYHFPGAWTATWNSHALTKDEVLAFRPFVWLGDEDRGMSWFCPSDQAFRPKDPDKLTEITHEGDQVVLRINMVEQPYAMTEPFSTTFGFEATPIRHNDKTPWDYRIVHTGNYGLEKQSWSPTGSVQWPAHGNINLSHGTIECWVRPRFDPEVAVKPDDPSRGLLNRDFLIVPIGAAQFDWYWNIDDRGMRFFLKLSDGTYPVLVPSTSKWRKDEWHHIAVSWGEAIRIYDNGKMIAEMKYPGGLQNDATGCPLLLGQGICQFDVDDLCISDIQREPRGQNGPLTPDEHTLLLEPFDALNKEGNDLFTVPTKAVGGRGTILGNLDLTDGKLGKSIAVYHNGPPMTVLDHYKDLTVRTICFHEHWSKIQDYNAPADLEGLHSLIKACHERDLSLLVYYGYEMANVAPEWDDYSDEVLAYPRQGGYTRLPTQTDYICCFTSAWQDHLAWDIAHTMDDYDMDGVYLDGTAYPWTCANLGHGDGYIGRDGQLHPTYTFFESREMMKRIYTIVKARKPNGQVNLHNSTCMTIPSIGWATSTWDGEQFGGIPISPQNPPLKILPLDSFRTEFMGRQWGVPSEMLCYGQPYTYAQALAMALPHDVLVRPNDIELLAKIWKAADTFGRREATFLPYWSNADVVRTNDDSVKCSIYSRGALGAMVVVSVLGDRDQDVWLKLNLKNLGLPPTALVADDMIDGGQVTVKGGYLSFPLPAMQFRILHIHPQ